MIAVQSVTIDPRSSLC